MLSSEFSIRTCIANAPSTAVTTKFATTTASGCRASHRANAFIEAANYNGPPPRRKRSRGNELAGRRRPLDAPDGSAGGGHPRAPPLSPHTRRSPESVLVHAGEAKASAGAPRPRTRPPARPASVRAALERPLEPDDGDDGVVSKAVVVQGVDAVGEDHDLTPHDRARAEGEVEEVLAGEVDPEEGLERRRAARRQVEERGVARRRARRELAPPEEPEREADPAGHVRVDADTVAGLALRDVVTPEIEPDVRVRLDARPEDRRRVEERRRFEVPRPLEVGLVAGRQAQLEPERRAPDVHAGELVLRADQDVADAVLLSAQRARLEVRRGRVEHAVGAGGEERIAVRGDVEVGEDDRHEEVDVEVVEHAVREAHARDVVDELEVVAEPVGGEAEERAGRRLHDATDDRIPRLETVRRGAVDLVQLDVLEAHVDVELAAPEGVRPLEEDRAEGVRRALEDLELGVVLVREAGRGGDDREVPGGGVCDRITEGVECAASGEAHTLRRRREAIAERERMGGGRRQGGEQADGDGAGDGVHEHLLFRPAGAPPSRLASECL